MEIKGVIAASIPQWISVNDHLPEKNQAVLCVGTKGGIFIANDLREYDAEKGKIWINGNGFRTFTHWMPLPEPPREV